MRKKKAKRAHNPFEKLVSYIPESLVKELKAHAKKMQLPVGRLVCIAIDNELDAPAPFRYPTELPLTEYVEYAYADEGSKIADYLRQFTIGTGRDTLLLARRSIGVESRDEMLAGIRECIKKDIVQEIAPPRGTKFEYAPGYKYLKLINSVGDKDLLKKKKQMLDKLRKQIGEIEERIEDDSDDNRV